MSTDARSTPNRFSFRPARHAASSLAVVRASALSVLAACGASAFIGCSGLPIPKLYNDAPSVSGALFRDGSPVGGVDVRLVRKWGDIEHVDERVTDGAGKFNFAIIEHLELMRSIPFLEFTKNRYEWELCFDHGTYCCSGSKRLVNEAPDKISTVCEVGELDAGVPSQNVFCQGELTKSSEEWDAPFQQCSFREPQLVEMQLRGFVDDGSAVAPGAGRFPAARRFRQSR